MDAIDRKILRLLQVDASLGVRELGEHVGLTATPCWRRLQALEEAGIIRRRVVLVDPAAVGLDVMAIVNVRANGHNLGWLQIFQEFIQEHDEVVEAYRTSGDIDYTLKVVVPSIGAFDDFYRRLISSVDVTDVKSVFVMEAMKYSTALPL
ncbi:MAG: Lrp/AsnC family transcriptional regulator [Ilumatobacteraceae bacterium]